MTEIIWNARPVRRRRPGLFRKLLTSALPFCLVLIAYGASIPAACLVALLLALLNAIDDNRENERRFEKMARNARGER